MEVVQQSSEDTSAGTPVSASQSNPTLNVPTGISPNQPLPQIPPQNFPPPVAPSVSFNSPTTHLQPVAPQSLLPMAQPSSLNAPIPASVLSLTPKKELLGPRPVASKLVPGTPWSIVWTSDGRTFFFNATSNSSKWSVPSELIGNQDVERILDHPPGGKSELTGYVGTSLIVIIFCTLLLPVEM